MGKRKERSNEDLQLAQSHIVYELNMLKLVSGGISSGVFGKSVLTNSLVESFAIHARNLIDFLWPEKPNRDHIIANDFFSDLEKWNHLRVDIPDILKKARIRAHKEIAHISYDRLRVKPEEKPWDYTLITKIISDNMSIFLSNKEI
jgi:hypothetical protein